MSELLERLKAESNPLIDGDEALFVWEGETAPYLHLENNHFEAEMMQRTEPGLWTYQVKLLPDAYIEYNFATEAKNPDTIVADPYNSNTVDTGVGHHNHYFHMPYRVHTPHTLDRRGISKGTVTEHEISVDPMVSGGKRPIWLYEPPTSDPVPLLVVLDGEEYYKRAMLTTIVDNLIEDGKIRPIAMAMIANAGDYRMMEYNQNESIPMLLKWVVLPFVNEHLYLFDVEAQVGSFGIMGASMGGLTALYTGLRMPEVFGNVISQAGAFFDHGDGQDALIHTLVDQMPQRDVNIWMDCGIYDQFFDANQDMRQRLGHKGYNVTYAEHSDGHNYTSWRDQVPSALETLFGA